MSTGSVTQKALDRKMSLQAKELTRWQRRAVDVVDAEVSDAKAHASKAVTDRLLAAKDGRPSLLRVAQSPSYLAAVGHLRALARRLSGSSSRSLDGILRDAREAFYREARKQWADLIPSELVQGKEPSQAEVNLVRGFPLHGMDLATELGDAVRRASSSLRAVIEVASRQEAISRDVEQRLETWRRLTESRFTTLVRIALSDGQMFADRTAGRSLIHPNYQETETIE